MSSWWRERQNTDSAVAPASAQTSALEQQFLLNARRWQQSRQVIDLMAYLHNTKPTSRS